MRNAVVLTALVALLTTTGCATRTEVALRERAQRAEARVVELEGFLQGAQDDNAALQNYGIELQVELRRWQMGAQAQAYRMEKLRRNCEQ